MPALCPDAVAAGTHPSFSPVAREPARPPRRATAGTHRLLAGRLADCCNRLWDSLCSRKQRELIASESQAQTKRISPCVTLLSRSCWLPWRCCRSRSSSAELSHSPCADRGCRKGRARQAVRPGVNGLGAQSVALSRRAGARGNRPTCASLSRRQRAASTQLEPRAADFHPEMLRRQRCSSRAASSPAASVAISSGGMIENPSGKSAAGM